MKITIAYQGVAGSNNEVAAHEFAKSLNCTDIHYIEGVSSKGVVQHLKEGTATHGVVATYNNLVGDVRESTLALDGVRYNILATNKLHIHHALFVKHKESNICTIASHPHALAQCANYIEETYPNAVLKEISDTAIGARHLSTDELSDTTAILCRRNAGEDFNLHMLSDNVADSTDNFTTFILFQLN